MGKINFVSEKLNLVQKSSKIKKNSPHQKKINVVSKELQLIVVNESVCDLIIMYEATAREITW